MMEISSSTTRPSTSFIAMLRDFWNHRHLLSRLVQRDVASRYRGSWMGILWSLLLPCVMLAVYLFVFGHVFIPVKSVGVDRSSDFVLSLFSGMLLHGMLAECLGRAPAAILSQPSYVKKVVFPIELLPMTVVGTATVQFLIGSSVLMIGLLFMQGLSAKVLLWPLVWLPLLAFSAGLTFMFSALTVYLRDLAQITGFLSTVLLFLSPVFYPLSSVSAELQQWLLINPLTVPIEASRALLINNSWPNPVMWSLHSLLCVLTLYIGWWIFQRTRRGFADVI